MSLSSRAKLVLVGGLDTFGVGVDYLAVTGGENKPCIGAAR